jgi:hypothetical protein
VALVALFWNVKLVLDAEKTCSVINYVKFNLNIGNELQLISWRFAELSFGCGR